MSPDDPQTIPLSEHRRILLCVAAALTAGASLIILALIVATA